MDRRHFPKDNILATQMVNRNIKRYSTLLILKEMQIKTTVRYHLTPVRKTIIKETRDNKCW